MEIWGFLISSKLLLVTVKCTTRPIYGLEYFPVSQHSSNLVQSFPLPIYQRMSCKMLRSKYLSSIHLISRRTFEKMSSSFGGGIGWTTLLYIPRIAYLYVGHFKEIFSPWCFVPCILYLYYQNNHLSIGRQKILLC